MRSQHSITRRYGIVLLLALVLGLLVPLSPAAADSHVSERDVAIPAGDHDIAGTLAVPHRATKPVAAVVMLHGFGSQKDEVGDMYARLADDLAARGIASLRIDFAGAGDSTQPWVENTYDGMVEDGLVALDWLIGLPQVADDRVGVLGFSLGTKVAMGVAGTDERVAALASWSGSVDNGQTDFQFFFDTYYEEALLNGSVVVDLGFTVVELSIEWFDTIAASQNLDLIAGYTNPLFAIAGTDDMTIDPRWSKALIRSAGSDDTKLEFIRGADHIYHVLSEDQTFAERVISLTARWFESRL